MYSPNIIMAIGSDELIVCRFARLPALARGRRPWAGPSKVAALVKASWLACRALEPRWLEDGRARDSGGAGLRAGHFFGVWILGSCGDLRLILAENYSLTTNESTTEFTERTEDAQSVLRRIPGSLRYRNPCGAVGGSARVAARLWLPCPLPALARGLSPAGRAVRGCGAACQAGRFVRQALAVKSESM